MGPPEVGAAIEPILRVAQVAPHGVLVWRWPAAVSALSSAAVGGGASRPDWVINVAVDSGYGRIDLAGHLRRLDGVALVDSLGTWVALKPGFDVAEETADLLAALAERDAPTVLVSEEVGLAVHPPSEEGRRFVEAVGTLNQQVAAVADRVLLIVAGRALELAPPEGEAC